MSRSERLLLWKLPAAAPSAQNPGLQFLDAELLPQGQHLIVEGRTGVASPVIQVSVQPQPKVATKGERKASARLSPGGCQDPSAPQQVPAAAQGCSLCFSVPDTKRSRVVGDSTRCSPKGFRVFFYSSLSLINVYNGTTLTICECKTFGMHLRRQGLTRGVNLTAEDTEPRTLEESIHFISFIRQQTWAGPGSELLQVSKGGCGLGPAASPGRLFRWLGEQRPCLELIKQGYHLYP